ncbi:MAG: glycyl-radical enzyme activating protein [Desulfosarcina sp.]
MTSDPQGLIFDIKKYAIHDGPGIRTTVFFKGCPLSCRWCHNPEGLSARPRVIYSRQRCIGCGDCLDACPDQAIEATDQGMVADPHRCRHCGTCVDVCPANARERVGRTVNVAELMEVIEKDVAFYDQSGGGVTFSGGEPLQQRRFLVALLDACGDREIHRAVDTTGYTDPHTLTTVARRTDLFLYDLKMMDAERHKALTGVSNGRILDNLRLLVESGARIVIRIPLIPGVNDDPHNISQTGAFLADLSGVEAVQLLPYHDFQKNKYKKFGLCYQGDAWVAPRQATMDEIVNQLKKYDLRVDIGG